LPGKFCRRNSESYIQGENALHEVYTVYVRIGRSKTEKLFCESVRGKYLKASQIFYSRVTLNLLLN